MKLDQVLGLTVTTNSALDCDPINGNVVYPAGCVSVIYNVKKNKQSHIVNSSRKTITSLAFSRDGRFLVTGECGQDPYVRVWNVANGQQAAASSGHKFGINCVAFSPNDRYVVSIGSQHDMMVFVWDWQNDVKIASNKVSCKVKAISFTESGDYFVTVGNRHVKFWYLQYSKSSSRKMDSAPILGRSAILGDQRNNYFCDVACGLGEFKEKTFAIARAGLLCEFNNRRLLDKWVELRTSSANCLSVGHGVIGVGCADGIIRCFNPSNLHFIATLPRPHTLGIDIAKSFTRNENGNGNISPSNVSKYPNTIAITVDENSKKITSIYSDHSMYVWDIRDLKRVGKSRSFLYHSACIWGVDVYPSLRNSANQLLPPGTFFTCSSDDTVRIWSLDSFMNYSQSDSFVWKKNIFSQDLIKILYIDPNLTYLCDPDLNTEKNEKADTIFDGKNGVRCIKVSPDGKHLACGDRSGNIRIFDFESLQEIYKVEAHDAEVLCIEYSEQLPNGRYLMASASRDRLIHVFDVNRDYAFVQTLPDHSSSITSVKFIMDLERNNLKLISCGADKSIIFRKYHLSSNDNAEVNFHREHHIVGKTTLYDMDIDLEKNYLLTACQDRVVRVYNAENGKSVQMFDGSLGNEGTLIKVSIDPGNMFVATSCTDKSMHICEMLTGECISATNGHSELITGLKFSFNGRHLISVSGDGCIFIWKLPFEMANAIASKLGLPPVPPEKPANILSKTIDKNSHSENEKPVDGVTSPTSAYRFNMKNLPPWAKKQMLERHNRPQDFNLRDDANKSDNGSSHPQPKGKWAQRMENSQNLVVKSYLNSDAVIAYPSSGNKKSESFLLNDDEMHSRDMSYMNRSRHFTDSSSASGSWQREEEDETVNNDSSDIVYYPQNESFRASSFEIRENVDDDIKDKLKRYRRTKSNLGRYGGSGLVPSVSVPNFNELHSDEDDSGTPGADSDRSGPIVSRNPLYVSTENLERLNKRERFMKSNFEMLDRDGSVSNEISHNSTESENRSSISARYLSNSNTDSNSLPVRSQIVIRSSSTLRPPLSKKREELAKTISEARKKLETLGWRESNLNSSRSVANLRDIGDVSFTSQKSSSIRRSISLSDLTIAPQRKFPVNTLTSDSNAKNSSTPLWERQLDAEPPRYDSIKRCSSSSSLNKSAFAAYLRPSIQIKSSGLLNAPAASFSSPQNKTISGRMSAPLQSREKSDYLNGGIHDSTDDEESSSDQEVSAWNRRPVTPPKPNILRQIRRSSTSQTLPNTLGARQAELLATKNRKHCENFELRPSKSEYNISLTGRDSLPRSRTTSNTGSNNHWKYSNNISAVALEDFRTDEMIMNDKFDLLSSNPASIPITVELVHHVVDELNHIATYAKKIYHRCYASGNISLCNLLVDGISKAYVNLSTVVPPPSINGEIQGMAGTMDSTNSLPSSSVVQAMTLLQEYSDRLASIFGQNMTKDNQKKA